MACNPTASSQNLYKLQGAVQHYDWGGQSLIPHWLGLSGRSEKPYAEYWVGDHAGGPAREVVSQKTLPALLAENPSGLLGSAIAKRYAGRLPYLLKLLDARKMLSIQAHPTLEQGRARYALENAAGVALSDPKRNYKDPNHKPEVHVALGDFWMLHGFRPLEQIAAIFQSTPEFAPLAHFFKTPEALARPGLLKAIYHHIMTMDQLQVDAMLRPLIDRLRKAAPSDKSAPDFWALRGADYFPLPGGHLDRGIFSVYLLNLVTLQAGEGTFQPAGTLHAYLEGQNVELMANSDNVLRGGLTPKHVDIGELMDVVDFRSAVPQILRGEPSAEGERVYRTPAAEFELSSLELTGTKVSLTSQSPEVLMALEGQGTVSSGGEQETLAPGHVIFIPCCKSYDLQGNARVFRAKVPV